jgi:hypothetical protein
MSSSRTNGRRSGQRAARTARTAAKKAAPPREATKVAAKSTTGSSPEEVVRRFLRAHFVWEKAAFRRSRGKEDTALLAAINQSKREYAMLISTFCAASVKPQPAGYGHPPNHDPKLEAVDSVTIRGNRAVVRTKARHLGVDFVADYEYRLVNEKKGWRIKSLCFVDSAGRWECL